MPRDIGDLKSAKTLISAAQVERMFLLGGLAFFLIFIVLQKLAVVPPAPTEGILVGLLFGVLNVKWWKIILTLFIQGARGGATHVELFFFFNLAFKILFLLLVIYGLSRLERIVILSFLIGFIGYLLAGAVVVLVSHRWVNQVARPKTD